MADPAKVNDQNILPVQALFNLDNSFNTFIGQGQPFYATVNPQQSGLQITNSTIDSTTIGATTPSTGVFTNIQTTTGQITTTPASNTDIANKYYVDSIAAGLNPKQAVKCATTANITLSGLQTIDTYSVQSGDRVLVKNQSNTPDNGIYVASSSAWTRSTDMNTWSEVPGAYTVVLYGSANSQTGWVSTSASTGTIGTTAITFVQFSGSATYFAGTGLTLASNTFSITNVGTAGTCGSASSVPVLAINAQGQVTTATPTAIAIAASQITSGTISSSLISGSYTGITGVGTLTAGTWNATPIANAYLANSSVTINGNAVSLGGSTTVTANTPNAVTFNNGGSGASSGTTFNGDSAITVSYNTVGAPSTTGTGASGTWGISVTGSASSATTATTATTATNLAGGSAYAVPYQTGSGNTSFLSAGTSGSLLMTLGSIAAPIWVSASSLNVGSATNLNGGAAGSVPYQTGSGATTFLGLGTSGYVLSAGASAPQYVAQSTLSVGTASNLAGGGAGYIPYQSAAGSTSFLSAGTTGQVLTSNGSGAPTWTTPTAYATVTDDTTTNATRYPLFAAATSGNLQTEYTSSTKYQYNPSSGLLTSSFYAATGTITGSLSAGAFSYGTLSYSDVDITMSTSQSVNSYSQQIQQNTNSGTASSADYIVSNNLGTASTYYGDFGITSSGYNTPGQNIVNTPSTVYLQSVSTDLAIGTLSSGKSIHFIAAGGATDAMTINSSGAVAFNGSYGTSGYVLQTAGSGGVPTWVAQSSLTAGNATNVAVTDNTSTNSTYYPVFVSTTSGNQAITTSSTKFKFNPSTGVLTSVGTILSSDARLKENVKSLDSALDKVMALNAVSYNRLDNQNTEIGFIAQEVQKIIPEVVDDSGEYLGIAYTNIVPMLVKAIQEQQALIEKLTAKLENL